MSPKLRKEKVMPIIRERFKEELKLSGKTQQEIADKLFTNTQYLSRVLKKGEIRTDWFEIICEELDVNQAYLSGKSDFSEPLWCEKRKKLNSVECLTDFMLSRGFGHYEHMLKNLTDSQLSEIALIISFMCENKNESVLDNVSENYYEYHKHIKSLEERIKKLEDNSSK